MNDWRHVVWALKLALRLTLWLTSKLTLELASKLTFIAILLNVSLVSVHALASSLPTGKTRFSFVDQLGDPARPITIWMFVPDGCDATCPLQFVMHGLQRNGETYLDSWSGFAKERKFIVIAPEFSRQYFPRDDDYSLGRATTEKDVNKWAFAVPDHLFDELKSRYGFTAASYRLFGHSAGGQFVHRLHLFYPDHHASPIIAANPGWYTQFEWGMDKNGDPSKFKFPYNTIGSGIDEARARAALSRAFVLMLGDKDIDANDASLNHSAGADAQGLNRFQRGQNFLLNAKAAAQNLRATAEVKAGALADIEQTWNWQSIIVLGVAHDNAEMAKAAVEFMYAHPESLADHKRRSDVINKANHKVEPK